MKKLILTIVLVVMSLVSYGQSNPLTLRLDREESRVELNRLAYDNCLIQIEELEAGKVFNKEDLFWHEITLTDSANYYKDNWLSIRHDFNYEGLVYKITLSYKDGNMGLAKFKQLLKNFVLYDKINKVYYSKEMEIYIRMVKSSRIIITEYYTLN